MQVYLAAKETAGLPAAGDASWSNATAGYNPGTGAFKSVYNVGQASATRYFYTKVVDAAGNAGIYDLGSYATAAAASPYNNDVWTFVCVEKADGVGGGNNLPGNISITELQWSSGSAISASDITFLRAVQGVTGDLVDGVLDESGGTVSIANASYERGNSLFTVKTPKTNTATTWTITYHRPIYRPGLVILKNGAIVYTDTASVATDALVPSPYSYSYAAPLPIEYGTSAVVPDYTESGALISSAYAAAHWPPTYAAGTIVPTFSGDTATGATVIQLTNYFSLRSAAALRLGSSATVSMYYKIAGTGNANNKRDIFGLRFNTGDEVFFFLDYQTGGNQSYAFWPGGSTTFGSPSFASTMRKYTLSVQMITATTATVTATIDNGAGGAYLSYTSGTVTMTSAPTSFFALVGFQEDVAPASQRMIRDVSLSTTGSPVTVSYNPNDYTSANATAGTSAKVADMGNGTEPALSSGVAKDDSDIYVVSHYNNESSGTCRGPAVLLKYDHAARIFSRIGHHSRTTSSPPTVLNYRDLAISMGNGGVPFFAQKFYDPSASRFCFYVVKYSGGAFSQVGTDYGYNAWTGTEVDVASGPESYNVRIACQMSASRVYVGYRASNLHKDGSQSSIRFYYVAESATSSTAWTNLALSPSISCREFSFAFTPSGAMYILAITALNQFKIYKVAISGSSGTVTDLYTSPATISGLNQYTYDTGSSIVAFSDTLLGFKFGISAVAATGYISNDAVVLPSAPPGAAIGTGLGTNPIDFDAFGNMYFYMSDESKIYRLPKLGTAWALQQTLTGAILTSQAGNRGQVVVSRNNADLVAFVDNYYQVFRPNSTLSM